MTGRSQKIEKLTQKKTVGRKFAKKKPEAGKLAGRNPFLDRKSDKEKPEDGKTVRRYENCQ